MGAKGVYTILPTPFTEDGALDEASLRRLVSFQIEAGVSGLAILGFMGEAHKLSNDERRTVVAAVVDEVNGKIPVWVGVRAFGTMGAVEQAREAQQLGAGAVFVAPIGVQDDSVLFDFYSTVAGSVDIPVVIHDFPESFQTIVSPALVARLAKETSGVTPGVQYIKLEEPPILTKLSKIRELSEDRIGIFGGLGGEYFLEELERGALGTMTGFSFPEILVAIYDQFASGDREGAARTFDRYCPLIRYEFQPKLGLAFRKYVYERRGLIDSTFVRPPGPRLDAYTMDELERVVERVGLSLQRRGVQRVA